jgi:hypothetical protein
MDEAVLDELRGELEALENAERKISAERRRLHQQIDYGFATAETRARERDVSDERRRLHQRIDSLRELLQARDSTPAAAKPLSRLSQWEGISPEAAGADDEQREQPEPNLLI